MADTAEGRPPPPPASELPARAPRRARPDTLRALLHQASYVRLRTRQASLAAMGRWSEGKHSSGTGPRSTAACAPPMPPLLPPPPPLLESSA